MLAAWPVGSEHLSEHDAGEVCVFEIDASAVGPTSRARTGIKAHSGPDLTIYMGVKLQLAFNGTRPHTWTVSSGGAHDHRM